MEETKETAGRVLKIGITGPESSGKTWMAQYLANHFDDLWLPEFAREYLTEYGPAYGKNDLYKIAREQLARESRYLKMADRILFCDTDILVLLIWYKYKFNTVPDFILEALHEKSYDLHLLMRPDIPYENDPLRENPEKGDLFFKIFREELEAHNLPYEIVDGSEKDRTKKARVVIRQLLDNTPA